MLGREWLVLAVLESQNHRQLLKRMERKGGASYRAATHQGTVLE